jgi:hypothetical protein
MFVWYRQGMNLGESLFRSLAYAPFHGMAYGDPLTQPYATAPELVVDLPWSADPTTAPPSIRGTLPVSVTASLPGGVVASVDVYVDGVRRSGLGASGSPLVTGTLNLDTTSLPDGNHELRVVALDGSPVRAASVWRGEFVADNAGRAIQVEFTRHPASPGSDTWSATVRAPGATELRVLEARRVLAASAVVSDTTRLDLPADPRKPLIAIEAEYEDGKVARWLPRGTLDIADGAPSDALAPLAFSYSADVVAGRTGLVDLPVVGRAAGEAAAVATAAVLAPPARGEIHQQGATTFFRASPDARGEDYIVFQARLGDAVSAPATVTLRYCDPPIIVRPPESVDICPTGSARLVVAATGPGPLSYQWTRDGLPIPGATSPTLELSGADAAAPGTYAVTVRSWCRSVANAVTSAPVSVSVGARAESCETRVFVPAVAKP